MLIRQLARHRPGTHGSVHTSGPGRPNSVRPHRYSRHRNPALSTAGCRTRTNANSANSDNLDNAKMLSLALTTLSKATEVAEWACLNNREREATRDDARA